MPGRDKTTAELIWGLERRMAALEALVVGRLALLQPVGVAATTPGAVVKKIEVFDASGTSLGFLAVYSTIS